MESYQNCTTINSYILNDVKLLFMGIVEEVAQSMYLSKQNMHCNSAIIDGHVFSARNRRLHNDRHLFTCFLQSQDQIYTKQYGPSDQ